MQAKVHVNHLKPCGYDETRVEHFGAFLSFLPPKEHQTHATHDRGISVVDDPIRAQI